MMERVLVCHSNKSIEGYLTVGKEYKAELDGYSEEYTITNDKGMKHSFTVEVDSYGESYKKWFTVKYTD